MNKRIGLYLQGGGAKGAFQVGALKALAEKEIDFEVIVGTSIGAINGMAIFYKGLNRMQDLWLEMLKGEYGSDRTLPVLETKEAVAVLAEYLGTEREIGIRHFYVNYAPVENGTIRHEFKDLARESDDIIRKYVSASSLLPNFFQWHAREQAGEQERDIFIELVREGKYDGYLLDGGLLNNRFMEPFLLTEVDVIYAVVFEKDFVVPEAIWKKYNKEQVVLIQPDFVFGERDSMLFQVEAFEKWLEAGYMQARKALS